MNITHGSPAGHRTGVSQSNPGVEGSVKPARTGLASAHEAVLEGERVIISLGDVGLPASRVGSGTLEKGSLRLRSGGGVSLLISHIAFLPYTWAISQCWFSPTPNPYMPPRLVRTLPHLHRREEREGHPRDLAGSHVRRKHSEQIRIRTPAVVQVHVREADHQVVLHPENRGAHNGRVSCSPTRNP
jgi:hypothetical protein